MNLAPSGTLPLLALAGPFPLPHLLGAVLGAVLLTALIFWITHSVKLRRIRALSSENEGFLKAQLESQQAKSEAQQVEVAFKLKEAAVKQLEVEDRFTKHRETAQIREQRADQRITELEADLATSREIAAQLEPTKARIGDLEAAVTAERGRVAAFEQTVAVTSKRADDLDRRLKDAQQILSQHQEKAAQKEAELTQALADKEKAAATELERLGSAGTELDQLRETQSSYQQQAEARIANLQRQLAAAEAKSAMIQKEFMSAVGVLPEATPGTPGSGKDTDRRARDLEDRLNQTEAESRKKAREDGYKIAELEYRLSEAQELAAKLKELEPKAAEVDGLKEDVARLTKECSDASTQLTQEREETTTKLTALETELRAELQKLTEARDLAFSQSAAASAKFKEEISKLTLEKDTALATLEQAAEKLRKASAEAAPGNFDSDFILDPGPSFPPQPPAPGTGSAVS